MTAEPANVPALDFTCDDLKQPDQGRRRRGRILYFKRPRGTEIPVGVHWKCVCGTMNVMNAQEEQYCPKCGSQLRHQENLNPEHRYCTLVTVKHFDLRR